MKIDPVSFLFNKNAKTNKKFYFISGNEITLIEKVKTSIIDTHQKNAGVNIKKIDDIKNFSDDKGLFESKKIFVGKNCKGFDEKNFNELKKIDGIFIFIFENSPKVKKIKQFLVKDNDSYLIDCYEIDRDSKII